jgi:predicted amidohydrolase
MVTESIDAAFDEIHRKEFAPVDVENSYEGLNLYSGMEAMREFDMASRVALAEAGNTVYWLRQKATSERVKSGDNDLNIVTYTGDRKLAPNSNAQTADPQFPFYLSKGKSRRARGLRINGGARLEARYDQKKWIVKNQDVINSALKADADIICFGEFDYPAIDDRNHLTRAASLSELTAHRAWIKKRMIEHDRPVFLFAGSSHCWTKTHASCANIGRIFIADRQSDDTALTVRFQRYEKRVAAKTLGEGLAQVPTPVLPYFGTSIGKIGVLICVDAFDPAIVMSVFANSSDSNFDRIGIILVPSYNPSRKLVRSCQHLSYLANCAVVYVNAFANAHHDRAQVFVSGISLRTWEAQLKNIKNFVDYEDPPDPRIFESIPGVRSVRRLVDLADFGREISVEEVSPGQGQLLRWKIPQGFIEEAQQRMNDKYPFNRRRVIASLTQRGQL